MSEESKAKLETFLKNRKLSPAEYEKQQIDREFIEPEKEPLDITASLFYMYNPRFQGQLNFMSAKPLKKLMADLAGCPQNNDSDINKLLSLAKSLNLKALRRVIAGVVENPLAETELKLLTVKEQKVFELFDILLTNKYFSCIQEGLNVKSLDGSKINDLEDIIKHKVDTNSSEFKKRETVEKDAFATGSKVLACKYLMWIVTEKDLAEKLANQEKEKLNGKTEIS